MANVEKYNNFWYHGLWTPIQPATFVDEMTYYKQLYLLKNKINEVIENLNDANFYARGLKPGTTISLGENIKSDDILFDGENPITIDSFLKNSVFVSHKVGRHKIFESKDIDADYNSTITLLYQEQPISANCGKDNLAWGILRLNLGYKTPDADVDLNTNQVEVLDFCFESERNVKNKRKNILDRFELVRRIGCDGKNKIELYYNVPEVIPATECDAEVGPCALFTLISAMDNKYNTYNTKIKLINDEYNDTTYDLGAVEKINPIVNYPFDSIELKGDALAYEEINDRDIVIDPVKVPQLIDKVSLTEDAVGSAEVGKTHDIETGTKNTVNVSVEVPQLIDKIELTGAVSGSAVVEKVSGAENNVSIETTLNEKSDVIPVNNDVMDLYLSLDGSDENDGLSADTPMQTATALLNKRYSKQIRIHLLGSDTAETKTIFNGAGYDKIDLVIENNYGSYGTIEINNFNDGSITSNASTPSTQDLDNVDYPDDKYLITEDTVLDKDTAYKFIELPKPIIYSSDEDTEGDTLLYALPLAEGEANYITKLYIFNSNIKLDISNIGNTYFYNTNILLDKNNINLDFINCKNSNISSNLNKGYSIFILGGYMLNSSLKMDSDYPSPISHIYTNKVNFRNCEIRARIIESITNITDPLSYTNFIESTIYAGDMTKVKASLCNIYCSSRASDSILSPNHIYSGSSNIIHDVRSGVVMVGSFKTNLTFSRYNDILGVSSDGYFRPIQAKILFSNSDSTTIRNNSYTNFIDVNPATTTTLGGVKVDGTTITINDDGVISSTGGGSADIPIASETVLGGIKIPPVGHGLTILNDGTLNPYTANKETLGMVKLGNGLKTDDVGITHVDIGDGLSFTSDGKLQATGGAGGEKTDVIPVSDSLTDVYLSTNGSDDNDGLTESTPMRTMTALLNKRIAKSLQIHLLTSYTYGERVFINGAGYGRLYLSLSDEVLNMDLINCDIEINTGTHTIDTLRITNSNVILTNLTQNGYQFNFVNAVDSNIIIDGSVNYKNINLKNSTMTLDKDQISVGMVGSMEDSSIIPNRTARDSGTWNTYLNLQNWTAVNSKIVCYTLRVDSNSNYTNCNIQADSINNNNTSTTDTAIFNKCDLNTDTITSGIALRQCTVNSINSVYNNNIKYMCVGENNRFNIKIEGEYISNDFRLKNVINSNMTNSTLNGVILGKKGLPLENFMTIGNGLTEIIDDASNDPPKLQLKIANGLAFSSDGSLMATGGGSGGKDFISSNDTFITYHIGYTNPESNPPENEYYVNTVEEALNARASKKIYLDIAELYNEKEIYIDGAGYETIYCNILDSNITTKLSIANCRNFHFSTLDNTTDHPSCSKIEKISICSSYVDMQELINLAVAGGSQAYIHNFFIQDSVVLASNSTNAILYGNIASFSMYNSFFGSDRLFNVVFNLNSSSSIYVVNSMIRSSYNLAGGVSPIVINQTDDNSSITFKNSYLYPIKIENTSTTKAFIQNCFFYLPPSESLYFTNCEFHSIRAQGYSKTGTTSDGSNGNWHFNNCLIFNSNLGVDDIYIEGTANTIIYNSHIYTRRVLTNPALLIVKSSTFSIYDLYSEQVADTVFKYSQVIAPKITTFSADSEFSTLNGQYIAG